MKLYNKGARTFVAKGDKNILPSRVTEIEDKEAQKLLKMFPRELVIWGDVPAESETVTDKKETKKK